MSAASMLSTLFSRLCVTLTAKKTEVPAFAFYPEPLFFSKPNQVVLLGHNQVVFNSLT